jgi:hypothetical protein
MPRAQDSTTMYKSHTCYCYALLTPDRALLPVACSSIFLRRRQERVESAAARFRRKMARNANSTPIITLLAVVLGAEKGRSHRSFTRLFWRKSCKFQIGHICGRTDGTNISSLVKLLRRGRGDTVMDHSGKIFRI